jgi:indolepyruvate ferredoxin oxidoreductase
LLPFSAASFEAAILADAPAPEKTLDAFRWGRASVFNSDALAAARPDQRSSSSSSFPRAPSARADAAGASLLRSTSLAGATRQAVEWRVRDLVDYQNADVAGRYLRAVERAWDAERLSEGVGTELSEAVAASFYKLLAYKDEYEVARLHLDEAFDVALRAELGEAGGRRYRLHPPMLRAIGLHRKLAIPAAVARPTFRVLRAGRRLRGTPFDPFGVAKVRRVERRLVDEYESALDQVLSGLDLTSYPLAVELAALPDLVRGYEDVKLRSVAVYEARRQELLREIRGER